VHEVKFDGYRVQAHKVGSHVVIYSRIAQLLHELPTKAAVLDGEVVASDADGRPNFARLHERWTRPGTIHLWAFDLLAVNGRDLRLQPLLKRQDACRPCWSGSVAWPFRYPNPLKTAWCCCA
jgi:bifunctional non-homologous end joining protein LigD